MVILFSTFMIFIRLRPTHIMAKNCKVCGIGIDHDEEVCSTCTEFFKMKYEKKYQERLEFFLITLEEFLTKLLEDKK